MWNTPVPQLVLAIEGKVDFVKKTNPFGSGDDEEGNKKKNKNSPKKKQGSDQNILEVFKKFAEADNKKNDHKPHTIEKQQ